MRTAIVAVAAALVLFNVVYYVVSPSTNPHKPGEVNESGGEGDIEEIKGDFVLVVPDFRIGDRAVYHYTVRALLYWENKTSGEWERYTIVGEGTLVQVVEGIEEQEDGFKDVHRTLKVTDDTEATFTLTIEGSDKDTQTIPGSLSALHSAYYDLYNRRIIKNYNEGSIRIDKIPELKVSLNYSGWLRSYPNLNEPMVPTLDERIYGGGREITVGKKGIFTARVEGSDFNQTYYWRAVRSGKLYGLRSMQINVTSSFFGFLNFNRSFWISEDSPFVLRGYTRTNQSYEDSTSKLIVDLTTTRDIERNDNLRIGEQKISWGSCPGKHYWSVSPGGEFKSWMLSPDDGSDSSSFDVFPLSRAVELAINRSEGLKSFLDEYGAPESAYLTGSMFNWTEDTLSRNRTYMWNLTFGYAATEEEANQVYRETGKPPKFSYNILVARTEIRNIKGEVVEVREYVMKDYGRVYGMAYMNREEVGDNILTISSAERLLKSDSQIRSKVYPSGTLQENFRFFFVMGAVGYTNNPGLILTSSLTGLTPPTSKLTYMVQMDTLYSSGNTFSAGVDAQSGQLLYVLSVEGTDLKSIF
ncbi:MAG: hypothetical protein J7L88_02975 [Thermoplasmata archaeon]|nr:hypothetical protein [Thermoplasmata archaeon]